MNAEQQPKIKFFNKKVLLGISRPMSLIKNETGLLWSSFMKMKGIFRNARYSDLFSIQIYPNNYFQSFNPAATFIKWAAIDASEIPEDYDAFSLVTIPEGWYAVFIHQGGNLKSDTFEYIFREWLPYSKYEVDYRPHFEILGDKYKSNDPNSLEEVWIPIVEK